MKHASGRSATWTAIVIAVMCVAAWGTHAMRRIIEERFRAERRLAPNVLLTNGLDLNIASRSDLVEEVMRSGAKAPRVLLMTVSDSCGFSRQELPRMQALLQSIGSAAPSLEVWIVTFEGEQIARALIDTMKAAGVGNHRLLRVRHRQHYARVTGLVATPRTLALDEERRVKLVMVQLSDEHAGMVRDFVGRRLDGV